MKKQKVCGHCGKKRFVSKFHKDRTQKDGFASECKECRHRYSVKNWKKYRESGRRGQLMRRTGWTIEEYDEAFKEQNGLCAICGKVEMINRRLAADHNHETGEIRELLCHRCNTVLGRVYEDIELLQKLIKYVKKYKST